METELGPREGRFRIIDYREVIGIMENKMETTIVYRGLYRDNGK